jgi:hypothetical protein
MNTVFALQVLQVQPMVQQRVFLLNLVGVHHQLAQV